MDLRFEPPDLGRFPAIGLGLEAAARGGTAGAVLNGADKAAVEAFLAGRLPFAHRAACRSILENHHFNPNPTLAEALAADRWARQEVSHWIGN